eukprot:SAG31_NODE_4399_length_3269_cov_11.372871_3_plen_184_part_00
MSARAVEKHFMFAFSRLNLNVYYTPIDYKNTTLATKLSSRKVGQGRSQPFLIPHRLAQNREQLEGSTTVPDSFIAWSKCGSPSIISSKMRLITTSQTRGTRPREEDERVDRGNQTDRCQPAFWSQLLPSQPLAHSHWYPIPSPASISASKSSWNSALAVLQAPPFWHGPLSQGSSKVAQLLPS